MGTFYIAFLIILGVTLSVLGFPPGQVLYIVAALGASLALLANVSPKTKILGRWWNLAPIVGLFLAGFSFDQTQSWTLAIASLALGFGVYFYCLTGFDDPRDVP